VLIDWPSFQLHSIRHTPDRFYCLHYIATKQYSQTLYLTL